MSCSGVRFTLGGLYASGVDSVTPVATGGVITPDGLYDSGGDMTTPETGRYTANYFSYKYGVGCVSMLNDWFSSVAMSCPCGGFKPHCLYESSWDSVAPVTGITKQITSATHMTFG